jgi:hypothetical protein
MTTTNSTSKLTKRDMFSALRELIDVNEYSLVITKGEKEIEVSPETVVEFLENEIHLLDNKNKVDRKPTAKQTANEEVKNAILTYLVSCGEGRTVSDIMKNVPECADFSNQRASALVRQLKDEGKLEREEIKRVAYFKTVGV